MRRFFISLIVGLIFFISSCASRAYCDAYGSTYETDSTEAVG